ncbi:MAG: flagellar motor protein MotB [Proteobacteria bacterium]|nr:flagellar motor protein MotB [Pseudomonadota bacterium]
MRKKNNNDERENLERWLLTYADLITLLLAFFIMMYTFSKQDAQKYDEVSAHLKAIFSGGSGLLQQGKAMGASPLESPSNANSTEAIKEKLKNELKEISGENSLKNSIFIFTDARGVVIRIMDKAFYDEGKADLKQGAKNALDKIVPTMKEIKNHIRIEGHTDNTPISKGEFKSNWELSVRRATEVVRYLIEKGPIPPERISATGYAEYRPIINNDTPENRALNRRVEIIIENTKY